MDNQTIVVDNSIHIYIYINDVSQAEIFDLVKRGKKKKKSLKFRKGKKKKKQQSSRGNQVKAIQKQCEWTCGRKL